MCKRVGLLLALVSLLGLPYFSSAEEVKAETPVQTIEVASQGATESNFRSYRHFKFGLDEFDRYHQLAPQGELKFRLNSLIKPGMTFKRATVHLERGDLKIALPLAKDGTFTIPQNEEAAKKNAEVIVKTYDIGAVMWMLEVRSPHVPSYAYRLGDLRLECHVYQAIAEPGIPRRQRRSFRIPELCDAQDRVWINNRPMPPVKTLVISYGDRSELFNLGRYRLDESSVEIMLNPMPGTDIPWPDDAVLQFVLADEPR